MAAEESPEPARGRIEFLATVVLAVAAILTAWAAFQSTKWSGIESYKYNRASAVRVESSKATTRAQSQALIDVQVFVAWLDAYRSDLDGAAVARDGAYAPDPATASGFLANRFRDEFLPAFNAWIASRPVVNAEAAGTPFDLPEYRLAAADEATRLDQEAEDLARQARQANTRGDNYVMLGVLYAVGLLFAGVSHRLETLRAEIATLALAIAVIATAAAIMLTFPMQF